MKAIRRLDLELNELGWWANWSSLQWLGGGAYLLSSKEMPEVFFNRGGLTSCAAPRRIVDKLEKRLIALGRPPALMVFEPCQRAIATLSQDGYEIVDKMIVMEAREEVQLPGHPSARIRVSKSETWSRTYLTSFYGELSLLPVTRRIADKIGTLPSATLLEADLGGVAAGVLALFRTKRLLGAYCVGTLAEFRRRGVAGALLNHSRGIASSEGRRLVLQTLESDGARDFYERLGFTAVYAKALMKKKGY